MASNSSTAKRARRRACSDCTEATTTRRSLAPNSDIPEPARRSACSTSTAISGATAWIFAAAWSKSSSRGATTSARRPGRSTRSRYAAKKTVFPAPVAITTRLRHTPAGGDNTARKASRWYGRRVTAALVLSTIRNNPCFWHASDSSSPVVRTTVVGNDSTAFSAS